MTKPAPLFILLAVLSQALAACGGHAGKAFDPTHAHDVQVGQDKTRISSWFGTPYQTTTFSANAKGCTEQWTYVYATSKNNSTHSEALVIAFDPRGTVCDTAFSVLDK
jgi:outer membrane protein assembly factor BamE (lipoprotein component of BamABCDE complex)